MVSFWATSVQVAPPAASSRRRSGGSAWPCCRWSCPASGATCLCAPATTAASSADAAESPTKLPSVRHTHTLSHRHTHRHTDTPYAPPSFFSPFKVSRSPTFGVSFSWSHGSGFVSSYFEVQGALGLFPPMGRFFAIFSLELFSLCMVFHFPFHHSWPFIFFFLVLKT